MLANSHAVPDKQHWESQQITLLLLSCHSTGCLAVGVAASCMQWSRQLPCVSAGRKTAFWGCRWPGGVTDALQDEDPDAEGNGSREGLEPGRPPHSNGAQHPVQSVQVLQQSHPPDVATDERRSSAVR